MQGWAGSGYDYGGEHTFGQRRPGWEKPIHDLLKETSVSIVFHGHDHFYAHQQVDGIVYQLVPQPGRAVPPGTPRQAAEYGYREGTILPGSGYLRAAVSGEQAAIEYIRAAVDRRTGSELEPQVKMVHSYAVDPRKL